MLQVTFTGRYVYGNNWLQMTCKIAMEGIFKNFNY